MGKGRTFFLLRYLSVLLAFNYKYALSGAPGWLRQLKCVTQDFGSGQDLMGWLHTQWGFCLRFSLPPFSSHFYSLSL